MPCCKFWHSPLIDTLEKYPVPQSKLNCVLMWVMDIKIYHHKYKRYIHK